MDYAALHAAITAGPFATACAPHVHTSEMPRIGGQEARAKDQAIADILNAGGAITTITRRTLGIGTVLDALGPTDGAAVLDALYALAASVRPIHYALMLLERGDLDVGMASTRAQIDALVGSALTAEQAARLKSLAEEPVPVTAADVSIALRG